MRKQDEGLSAQEIGGKRGDNSEGSQAVSHRLVHILRKVIEDERPSQARKSRKCISHR